MRRSLALRNPFVTCLLRACMAALPLWSPQTTHAQDATAIRTLPQVRVIGETGAPEALPPTESTTVIDTTTIERKQAATIFDVVKDAPGVSVDGGPRATGMKFNIRGFRGNEDVLFKIDGGVKGFEKYRFGSGVFIEPELIKSVTIERGPSLLTGSGAIGGAVIATTKSAADLLAPGQRIGAMLKLGYDTNNHGRLGMVTVYGRPTETSDLVVSTVTRDSTDFQLANGQRFPATAEDTGSSLLKFSTFLTDALHLELSRTAYRGGPTYTPFDANSSNAFVGGYVHQNIDDETLNARFTYDPGSKWLKLRGTLAHETTYLSNEMRTGAGESTFTVACTTRPCVWNALGGPTGTMVDHWKYRIWTAEVFNDSTYALGAVSGVVTAGFQGLRNARDLQRLTENPLMNLPDGKYPAGYDAQQPPGIKTSQAVVAQNVLNWSDFSLATAVRRDRYQLDATGHAAIDRQAANVPASYDFSKTTRSAAITWRPNAGAWWLTHRWSKGFKPPLLTDHFGMAAASPCSGFHTSGGQQIAPLGCGDLLVPTRSVNRELSAAWMPERDASGARTQVRLTYYRIATSSLNGATYLRTAHDTIVQPFDEQRRGVELEMNHETRHWYAGLNLARIQATRSNRLDGSTVDFTAGIPGTTLGFNAGYRFLDGRIELGYRLRQLWDQLVVPGATGLTESTQYCGLVTGRGIVHAANTQQDVFAMWRATPSVTVNVGIHNLFNKHWCNNGDELGNIIGLQGPGRSVRVSMTMVF